MQRLSLRLTVFLVLGLAGLVVAVSPPPKPDPVSADHARLMAQSRELFGKSVRGILADNCLKCHGGDKTRAEFSLATREALLKGGENGAVVVPGKGKNSKLYRLTAHHEEPHMPPKDHKRLMAAQLADLARWIDLGAAYDKPLIDRPETPKTKAMVVSAADRDFWSFRPLARPRIPEVKAAHWANNPIDRFVLAKMEEKKLAPTPEAGRRTLIRRAYFGLVGLPPSPEAIAAYLADTRPDAYERLVDELLASPAHGERWGRHWLDVVRFAESHGFEHDYDRPHAYPYRDFVLKALNDDLPYDTFTRWQLAGDEFAPKDPLALTATGFLGAGVHSTQITANTVEKERYDELDDIVRTMGTAMLGLTVGCARCHDHKYDPIPTRDYYRLISTFTKTVRSDYDVIVNAAQHRAEKEHWSETHAGPELQPEKVTALICSEGVPAVRNHTQGPDFYEQTFFLSRGDLNKKEGEAPPGFLQVLASAPEERWNVPPPAGARTPWRRASLAKWLTDKDAGAGHLLARVIVNRLWQHHFGRGLVATPSDFGAQGDRPTHPELLDWLAGELIRGGWKLKPLHKLMMTGAAYMQSAQSDSARRAADPANTLVWRHPRQRIEGEVIRDSILAVTGALDPKMFGPGTLDAAMKRRSIYFQIKRSQLPPMMITFDAPDTLGSMGLRSSTTVAPQALLLMNNAQVRTSVRAWAKTLASQPATDAVKRAYLTALGRPPSDDETATAAEFLRTQTESYKTAGKADAPELALTDFCQSLVSLNEFVYVE